MSFEALGLSDLLVRGVRAAGYRGTTTIQDDSIPHILAGRDLFGVSKTGSGKTAAFCLPMLQRLSQMSPVGVPHGISPAHRRTRALVLSPTRESATQIGERLKVYGQGTSFTSVVLHAGGNHPSQTMALRSGVDIIVATPGWLHELMVQGYVYLTGLQFVVIDEADRMIQAGMLPQLNNILRALPVHRQSVLFAEALSDAVIEFGLGFVKNPVTVGFKMPKPKVAPPPKAASKVPPTKSPRLNSPKPPANRVGSAKTASSSLARAKAAEKAPAGKSSARATPKSRITAKAPVRSTKPGAKPLAAGKSLAGKALGSKALAGKAGTAAKSKAAKTPRSKLTLPKSAVSKVVRTKVAGNKGPKEKVSRTTRAQLKTRSAARSKAQTGAKSTSRGRSA